MKQICIPAEHESFEQVMTFVDEYLEEAECPMKVQMTIDVAVEEIYVNIASYAYPEDYSEGDGMAEIEIDDLDDKPGVLITFRDSGIAYNPLEKPDPDITLTAEEREIGGLGIYMVKKSMDDVTYNYENGRNVFSIKKYF